MDKIEYQGETYTRNKTKWLDSRHLTVHDSLQKTLNELYTASLDPCAMDMNELLEHADKFKASSSFGLAIRFYEYAAEEADFKTLSYILPKLTSCYRHQGFPEKAIEILTFAREKFGAGMISPVLLTSAAAAYCDMGQYDKAKMCCDRAYAMLDGKASGELRAVYGRIDKNTK